MNARARELLGAYEDNVLLPPPPRKRAVGSLVLGEIVYPGLPRYPFGLHEHELLQGLAILGRTGSGKTTVVFSLLERLARRGVTFMLWDWKMTGRHAAPELGADVQLFTPGRSLLPMSFNPLILPPGMEQRSYVTKVVDILASAFSLGDGAKNVLQRELLAAYERGDGWPTFEGVLRSLEREEGTGRARGWRQSAIRALQTLTLSSFTTRDESSQAALVQELLNTSSVIELDGLGDNAKRAFIPLLMQWLFEVRLRSAAREQLKLVVVVEEAHHVLYRSEQRSEESLMNQFLRQGRELGIGFVVVDQHPSLLSKASLGGFTTISLNLTEPSDVNRAAALSLLGRDEKRFLGMLPVGQGIVRMRDRWNAPFVVCFDHLPIEKGAVTDEVLRVRSGRWSRSSARRSGRRGIRRVPRVPFEGALSSEARRLFDDVVQHPADGMRRRYERLGLSVRKGGRLRDELIARGWVEAQVISLGRTRRLILGPTRHARRVRGLNTEASWGSIEHRFWQHYWAERLRSDGYEVTVEARRHGGRVDVLAQRPGESVAVEVETGKSDAVRNVRSCLRSPFDRIVVVATSKEAKEKVVRQLERAGLLGRVEIRVGAVPGRDGNQML